MIEFRAEKKLARLHDPRQGFALTAVEAEVRYHPLTGESARICHFSLKASPPVDLDAMVAASAAGCPFCPAQLAAITPRFPDELVPGGRLARGGAVVFPNLFPYDDVSGIAVLCAEHFQPMDAMPERPVVDGLTVARDFTRLVSPGFAGRDAYGVVTWNYMPPAGGTQVHPHMQVVVTTTPGNAVARLLAASDAYRVRAGRAFSPDLLEAERGGPRWIGEADRVAWLVPFAPIGVLGDAMAIFRERATIAELDDGDIAAFAASLTRVLAGFAARGLWSFNLSLLPDRIDAASDRHWLTAHLVPRLWLNPRLHVGDASHFQLLLGERFAMRHPEAVAADLRPFLAG
jgi:galactose-1-phosphate uridylyltransferase